MYLKINTDGGSRGNPGPAGAGVYICDQADSCVFAGGYYLGKQTNNIAEYMGLLRGLEKAIELGATDVLVLMDSELIVKQINRVYRVKNANLKVVYDQVVELIGQLDNITVRHVYRDANKEADQLANDAMDSRSDTGGLVKRSMKCETAVDCNGPVASDDILLVDMRKVLKFNSEGICAYKMDSTREEPVQMIALEPGKTMKLNVQSKALGVTIMRGKGVIVTSTGKLTIQAGNWVKLTDLQSYTISSNPTEQLILVQQSI